MTEHSFQDKIALKSLEQFRLLSKNGKPKETEWTILSCILVEINEHLEVVALGTGSKCIGQNNLSPNGDILNDSHAEIICRRSFLLYLYEQINLSYDNNSSIFVFEKDNKNLTLNNNVRFHFFTTHVPCGDAAIFPKQNNDNFGEIIEDFASTEEADDNAEQPAKKPKLDIYRTGAKCLEGDQQDPKLEGCGYHILGAVRRKPGRGDPTLSVSCSDKISKWCHLGIQGSLLYLLINKPIYLSSFTIIGNTPFSNKALERALYNRLEHFSMDSPFSQHKLLIGQSTLNFEYVKTETKYPSSTSISWIKVNKTHLLEVAVQGKRQGVTKKNKNTAAARMSICKLNLFKKFINTVNKLQITLNFDDMDKLKYKTAKTLSKEYTQATCTFKNAVRVWTKKPENLSDFSYDL